jgi:hypothetical protein
VVVARSKAWVYDSSHAGIVASNPAGVWCSVLIVACCQVEFSALG